MSEIRDEPDGEFDLQPDPRILPMLGEINLAQWKCLAELIDNAVDGFLSVTRAGGSIESPQVNIQIPTNDDAQARVTIRDNGPGMSAEVLERAVRAGWSGNDPLSSHGMFGMGFNIATARLGTVTEVFTTREGDTEWVGLRIDFDDLRAQRHFKTPRLTEPKQDNAQHGTRIVVSKLKAEQREWFARAANRTKVGNELSRAYAAMLRPGGLPLTFQLLINGRRVEGRRHCVWGGPENTPRVIQTSRLGLVDAFQSIDRQLGPRPFCKKCWVWLSADDSACPGCQGASDIVKRPRVIRGWIGIQRYLHETDYGIDFLRHGRKIELANKELFFWADGETNELEYPIDDPRSRGRIVGEIHLDHCRVSYTKDRFDRTDPAWEDMIRVVRGDGPLRPDRASALGFGLNDSPLYKLFQIFRRSSPKTKAGAGWAKLLVVKDNNTAEEFGKRFHASDSAFQTDDKWFELVQEQDRESMLGTHTSGGGSPAPPLGPADSLPGFGPTNPGTSTQSSSQHTGTSDSASTQTPPAQPPAPMRPIASMTKLYMSDMTGQRWNVSAFHAAETHPTLRDGRPWALRALPNGIHEFMIDADHPVFLSATMTPLDGLLGELAWSAMDFVRNDPRNLSYGLILAELRAKYAASSSLDPVSLANEARQAITAVSAAVGRTIEPSDAPTLFRTLPLDDQRAILQRMASRGAPNPQAMIASGRFLEYAQPSVILNFFVAHPELFLDGRCWDASFSSLNYELPEATEVAQRGVVREYEGRLHDTIWLAEQDAGELAQAGRARLLRALYAVELVTPISDEAEGD